MPDGHTIYNVPDDVKKEEVVNRYLEKTLGPKKEQPTETVLSEDSDFTFEDPEEPSFATEMARSVTSTASSANYLIADVVNSTAKLFGAEEDVVSEKLRRAATANFANAIPGVDYNDIMDVEGKVRPTETIPGIVADVVPYIAVGSATMATKAVAALPTIVGGIVGGVAADQLLYRGEENFSTMLSETEFAQANSWAKDILDYVAIEEDDTVLEKRVKLLVEGAIVGGSLDAILGGIGKVYPKAKELFNKSPKDLTIDEEAEVVMSYLKDAQETAQYRQRDPVDLGFSSTAESASQVAQQGSGPVRRFMQQMFTSRGYWTPEAYNAFEDSQYAQRQLVAQAENISNRLQIALRSLGDEATTETATVNVQRALKDDLGFHPQVSQASKVEYVVDTYGVSPDVAEEVLNARTLIDDMSATLANSSIPDGDFRQIIVENAGSYIRRSYRLFEDSGYKPSESLVQQAEDYLVQQQLKRFPDLDIDSAREKARGQVDAILAQGENATEVTDYYSKVRRVNTEILKKKEDIPEPIRKLMGEIEEPSENIVLTVSKLARLNENNTFFESFARFGYKKYLFDEPIERNGVQYVTKISGTNSALDGKFTTPEMLTALKERESQILQGPNTGLVKFLRNFSTIKGTSQATKTIYSHVTHLRNILGGAQFGIANGTNPFANGSEVLKVLKNRLAQGGEKELDSMYEKYLRLGIINTNVRVNEFRALLDTGYTSSADTLMDNLSTKLSGYGLTQQAQRMPAEIYMAVDDFYKIANFNTELKTLQKAFPDEAIDVLESEAARIVQNTFPNYDRVPKGIKALRYLPVGNFVAFPTEIWRTSLNIVKQAGNEISSGNKVLQVRGSKRLAGFSTAMAGSGVLAGATAKMAGLTEDEAAAVQNLSETPWSKSPRNIARVGDKLFVNDTQFIDSYSPIKTPILEAYQAIQEGSLKGQELDEYLSTAVVDATMSLLTPYVGESIVTESFTDILIALKNEDGRTPSGKPLFIPGKPKTDQVIDGIAHILQAFEPGTLTSLRSLSDAAFEVPNKTTGKTKDLGAELFTNLTGVRFTEFSAEDSLMYATKDYVFDNRNIVSMKPNYVKKPDTIKKQYIAREEKHYENQQNLYLKFKSAETLLGREKASLLLADAGLSDDSIAHILSNRFKPELLNDNTIFAILNKTKFADDENVMEFLSSLITVSDGFAKTMLIPVPEEEEESLQTKTEKMFQREKLSRGGEVDIPQAPKEPDQRIDKMTGKPYNVQAGKAFIDDEDPEKRMALAEGGVVSRALGISDEDVGWATGIGKTYGKAEEWDGRGDAARHLALGWLAKKARSPSVAQFAINAREFIQFDRMKYMDIENNNKGFELAAETKDEAEKEIRKMIENKEASFLTPQKSREIRGY
tara:strand:- start:2061 stop:6212 length:4152 start_codon:yes stop_codon:yes gene_type:complete